MQVGNYASYCFLECFVYGDAFHVLPVLNGQNMRMGGRNSGFKYGNGTVVTGFPIVERWSCYRSLPTVTECMESWSVG